MNMRRSIILLIASFTLPMCGAMKPRPPSVEVTLCDLYEHPEKYSGGAVIVRATAAHNMMLEDFTAPKPCSAYMRLKIVLPVRGKMAEESVLVRDAAFAEFENKLQKGMNVVATFEGSFVPVFVWRDQKRTKIDEESEYGSGDEQSDGFLVLHRVRDVVGRPKPHR